MINLKNKKGITLVSLMVTVIVMLILAGVAVGYSQDGVFSKAEDTYQKNKMAEDKEELERVVAKIMETKSIVTTTELYNKMTGWNFSDAPTPDPTKGEYIICTKDGASFNLYTRSNIIE